MTGVLAHARRFHFVGIGGIGMSSLAELLLNLGYDVSGSDMHPSEITSRLEALGARVARGHAADYVGDAEVLVYSSAVKGSNPELAFARERGLVVLPRAELLAELMGLRRGIAVAGAHGKTTTTSMIAVVLDQAGLDPTAVIGGRVSAFGSNARLGRGEYLIAEADESDRSFLRLHPYMAVITNVDHEHMEAYRDFADLQGAFVEFANRVPPGGFVVLCADDPYLRALRASIRPRTITYGFSADADVAGTDVRLQGFEASCVVRGSGELRVGVPGRHNVLNALAAVAVGRELGIDWQHISRALAGFRGAERRFQRRGDVNGIVLVEDYGHHPTEIAAVVATARSIAHRRLIAAFQPHRFTRTERLLDEFGPAFADVDVLLLTDIYAASEDPIPGVTLEGLAAGIRKSFRGDLRVVPRVNDLPRELGKLAQSGDLILLLGAGSIGSVWPGVLKHLGGGDVN